MPNPRKNQIIYRIVKQIPAGKVTTYGVIAKSLGLKAKSNEAPPANASGIFSAHFVGAKSAEAESASQSSSSLRSRFSAKADKRITPRMVGMALHKNPDPKEIPCHRVVNQEGKLAENYAFGGKNKQRELLLKEGVKFKSKYVVDLTKCLWENST